MRKVLALILMVTPFLFAGCATKPCDDMDMGAKHRHHNMKKEGGGK